jgi:hypothetical protein
MFCDVFAGFASTLENISKIREDIEDKWVKSIIEARAHSYEKVDNIGSSEVDTTILEGDPNKGGTSKKIGNVNKKLSFHG